MSVAVVDAPKVGERYIGVSYDGGGLTSRAREVEVVTLHGPKRFPEVTYKIIEPNPRYACYKAGQEVKTYLSTFNEFYLLGTHDRRIDNGGFEVGDEVLVNNHMHATVTSKEAAPEDAAYQWRYHVKKNWRTALNDLYVIGFNSYWNLQPATLYHRPDTIAQENITMHATVLQKPVSTTVSIPLCVGDTIVPNAAYWEGVGRINAMPKHYYEVIEIDLARRENVRTVRRGQVLYDEGPLWSNYESVWGYAVERYVADAGAAWRRVGCGETSMTVESTEPVTVTHRWKVGDKIRCGSHWAVYEITSIGLPEIDNAVNNTKPTYGLNGGQRRGPDTVTFYDEAHWQLVEEKYDGYLQVGDIFKYNFATASPGWEVFDVKRENGENRVLIGYINKGPGWWEFAVTKSAGEVTIVGGPRYTPPIEHAFKVGDKVQSKMFDNVFEVVAVDPNVAHTYQVRRNMFGSIHRAKMSPDCYSLYVPKTKVRVEVEVEGPIRYPATFEHNVSTAVEDRINSFRDLTVTGTPKVTRSIVL